MTYSTIFSDCFDTIIMRREHPLLLLKKWARGLARLYPGLSHRELYRWRTAHTLATVTATNDALYTMLRQQYDWFRTVDKDTFCADSHRLERLAEASTHYINRRNVDFLKKCKTGGKNLLRQRLSSHE